MCAASAKIKHKTAVAYCENVAPGNYAAFIFHDENNNGVMDHNWLGLPKEKFGYYKNFKVKLLPPSFDDVAFNVSAQDQTYTTTLQDFGSMGE